MAIRYFIGGPALSPFRLEKLGQSPSAELEKNSLQIYVCDFDDCVTELDIERVEGLLAARLVVQISDLMTSGQVILPRPGTISPWSSKATDIARRCHLHSVRRLEKGRWLAADEGILCHDPMTEAVYTNTAELAQLMPHAEPRPVRSLAADPTTAQIEEANQRWSLGLSAEEAGYLADSYQGRPGGPTDAELMMFAQANSEHCRHKIFNASWTLNGMDPGKSLFGMIRESHRASPAGVLTAYSDNSAVLDGGDAERLLPDADDGTYRRIADGNGIAIKVETHNHPTAISPHPGAATGSGGEIRDETATGRGARPKAGLVGFSVSNLHIPGFGRRWESAPSKPAHIASALDIMIEGPVGAASFNNEFGRPAICGYFRTLEQKDPADPDLIRGYHKPIMLAGGMGTISKLQVVKNRLAPSDRIIVLGGPAMLIGLGGGAASSVAGGSGCADLDFASVQRGNPEMQRRCQEVIDRCWSLGVRNPIVSIHDVGAGGLSNAIPELLEDSERGGVIDLRSIPNADPGLSPMEIWSNESQERYVMAVPLDRVAEFAEICDRERCPFADVGPATLERRLIVEDSLLDERPVDLPMSVLFGNTPAMHRTALTRKTTSSSLDLDSVDLAQAIGDVLRLPAVGSKKFLVTIGDRSVGGLVARDQMVGPFQVPVADCGVTLRDFFSYRGEALAIGERTPLACANAPASGRMAVGEALTNLAGVEIGELSSIKLSANWMAAAGPRDDADLFATVQAVGAELCPALGIAIPVGKDSLSMRMVWEEDGATREVDAPVSLVVSAFCPVDDVRRCVTPLLADVPSTVMLLDLGADRPRLGGSALSQVNQMSGGTTPDLDDPDQFIAGWRFVQAALRENLILACHDRSDGGVFTSLMEMAFAARCGLNITLDEADSAAIVARLFNEELGLVLQVANGSLDRFMALATDHAVASRVSSIAARRADDEVTIVAGDRECFRSTRADLEKAWAETSYAMARLRDNPACADAEFATIDRVGFCAPSVRFELREAPAVIGKRPTVAILREQGVNGQIEMAAAFDRAGFDAVDVHMSDLISGRHRLSTFTGFVACGGFSYGDVLGAGRGWANVILYREQLKSMFAEFLDDTSRFALGVCNGCQMLSALAEIIPGTGHWPTFHSNQSEQFEARLSMVQIEPSRSIFLQAMAGSRLPVVVSHGEGRVVWSRSDTVQRADIREQIAMRFVDQHGEPTDAYPDNPNGSAQGVTGLCNADGRITIMMPHPERVFRNVQLSWRPNHWEGSSPWMKMFQSAREWVE